MAGKRTDKRRALMAVSRNPLQRFVPAMPAAVFLLGICLSVAAGHWQNNAIGERAANEFQRRVERVSADISRRFNLPRYGLNGAKGLYAASERVTRAEFSAYVESRDLPRDFPGVRGFGFIQRVMRPGLDAFIATERKDGAPQFAVRQLADKDLADLLIIKFIEPMANNVGAQGLDIGSEKIRRAAAEHAIDSGEPTITGAITLVQDNRKTPGVLLYVPVYSQGTHPTNAEERRAALLGLLYAPIVIAELLDGMTDVGVDRVDIELFDGATGTASGALLYDADHHLAAPPAAQDAKKDPRFSITTPLWLPVRDLTLHVRSSAGFDAAIDRTTPWLTFASLALISALLALLLRQQAGGRRRAEFLAQQMTEKLQLDEMRARDFSTSASDWFWETDVEHRFCYFSDNFEPVYGLPPGRLLGKSRRELLELMSPHLSDTTAAHLAQLDAHLPFKNFEYQIRIDDGDSRWISVSGVPYFSADGRFSGYRGTGSVITERKRSEEKMRLQSATLSALFENFPGGISLFDADLHLTAHNSQFRQLLHFPDALFAQPVVTFEDVIRYNAERGEYGPGDTQQQIADIMARARDFRPHLIERTRPDGTVLEVRGMPQPDGGFVTIYMDITERKRQEAATAELGRQLTELNQRFVIAADAAKIGVWEYDLAERRLIWDARMFALYGVRAEDFSGAYEAWQNGLHPDDRANGEKEIGQALRGEKEFDTQFRVVWPGGEVRHIKAVGVVLRAASGKPLRMIGVNYDVTERVTSQMALVAETARMYALLETASDGIHILNADGKLVQFSHSFATMLGYTEDEVSQLNLADWDQRVSRDTLQETIREAMLAPLTYETRHRRKDGSIIDVEINAKGIEIGGVTHLYAASRDITQRKRHEAELADQSRRLADIIDGTNVGTWEWNVDTGVTILNERWAEILGYTLDELTPVTIDTWMNLAHPDDLKRSKKLLAKHFAGETDYFECESRMRHKDGHWVWVLDRGKIASRTAEGKPLLMSGTHQDITLRKDAEAQLLEAESLLRSSIETIGEAFVVYDAEDRLAFCNEKYRDLYHLSAPAIVPGRSFEEILRYGVEHQQYKAAIGREEAWIAERLAVHHQGNQQLIQQIDDGRWLKITERRTPSGHIVGFRVDVTEFYRAKEAAEAANTAKSRFLATMSHEIRTPMNGILGMAQMLLVPGIKDDARLDYARTILNSGHTLLALLNDILDMSKVEAGKIELESTAFEAGQILHETQTLFAEAAAQKGLRMEAAWNGPAQRYQGDPHRLRQMLANLVGNALKFTSQGLISIEAQEVERDAQRALLEFSVSDTGIGIPADKQALLFNPFSQADSSTTRQFGGTGLGLSLVRSMAMLMGGDVGIDSEAGRGSRFWFRIRADLLAPGTDSREEVRLPTVGADGTAACGQAAAFTGHILVVDDNTTNRMVLKAMLDKPGVQCAFAENGQQAVDAITGGMAADLVLMDCQMPILDGYQATRRIRHWEAEHDRPRLTIVALTASAYEDDRQNCLDAGMDDFLTKPIAIEKLMATLEHWLAGDRGLAGAAKASAITPEKDELPVFDEKTLLAQLGGSRELATMVMQSATQDIAATFDRLDQAIGSDNPKDAQRLLHTLKGLAAQIGATRFNHHAKETEDRLKAGTLPDNTTMAALRQDYQALVARLPEWLH
jgi:PAS domain S-box-containing protein